MGARCRFTRLLITARELAYFNELERIGDWLQSLVVRFGCDHLERWD